MAGQLDTHNAEYPHDRFENLPNGITRPGVASRAGDRESAMQSVQAVKPILSGRYLVKGWLDRGSASVVYDESNVGKTFFALDLAMHVAARLPWHGVNVAGMGERECPGQVYYLALDGGSPRSKMSGRSFRIAQIRFQQRQPHSRAR